MGIPSHGQSQPTATYTSWANMKQRCTNKSHPRYKDWGGRGIRVCESWLEFSNFYIDMGEKPSNTTLDRADNNGNYEKSNCHWVTLTVQAANKRLYKNNSTGYRGVRFIKSLNKFTAQIRRKGKQLHLGCYSTAKEAGKAYQSAKRSS